MAVSVAGWPPACVKGDGGGSAYCKFPTRTAAHSRVSATMWDSGSAALMLSGRHGV